MDRVGACAGAAPRILIVLCVCFGGQGCATTATLSELDRTDRALVMSGTRLNLSLIEGREDILEDGGSKAGVPRYPWLDLPFSFVLDTMLLAFTLPTAAILYIVDR